ncbi:MAG TPA: dephospho-CoA kinase [Bacteroidia bacterium]|jgi:dephospho-CoA kinase
MKVIGITGGIGSGKSTVCRIFKTLGIPVFNADDEAKKLYSEAEVRKKVTALLGEEVYRDGALDRAVVAKKVFSDKTLLAQLNNIIHPAVQEKFVQWCKENASAPYVIKEAAILFEAGSDKDTDAVITVTAPKELKIQRAMKRDGISAGEVEKRMKNQWSDEEKIKRSRFVIKNDEMELLIPQVMGIHKCIAEQE